MGKRPLLDTTVIPPNCLPLINQLVLDYPHFSFRTSKRFSFRLTPNSPHQDGIIFIGPPQPFFALQTLHELSHAINRHQDFTTSIGRLKLEREAWDYARLLLTLYSHLSPDEWDTDFVEESLDTYRIWLHQKTVCPHCGLTRFQTDDGKYHCPSCDDPSFSDYPPSR